MIGQRIKQIRSSKKLTQDDFAEIIGLTKNFISLIETGNRTPSDRTISDICRVFHVNESWLRTGDGEMFKPVNRDAELAAFLGDIMKDENDDYRRRLLSVLQRLDRIEDWELLEKVATRLADGIKKED